MTDNDYRIYAEMHQCLEEALEYYRHPPWPPSDQPLWAKRVQIILAEAGMTPVKRIAALEKENEELKERLASLEAVVAVLQQIDTDKVRFPDEPPDETD